MGSNPPGVAGNSFGTALGQQTAQSAMTTGGGGNDWMKWLGGLGGLLGGGLLGSMSANSAMGQLKQNNSILQGADQSLLGLVGQAQQSNQFNRNELNAGLIEDQTIANQNNTNANAYLPLRASAPGKLLKNDGIKTVFTGLSGLKKKANTGKFQLLGGGY